MKKNKYLVIVKPPGCKEFFIYSWYVNYTFEQVRDMMEVLPRGWDYDIQRCWIQRC